MSEKLYDSKYGGGQITAEQFLVEFICSRQAAKSKKQLGYKFWTSPEWKKEYRKQILFANQLTKVYSVKAILAALNSDSCKWVTTLGAKKQLDSVIAAEQQKLDLAKQQQLPIDVPVGNPTFPKNAAGTHSLFSKLD